ncbi:glutamate decarboxylase [Actinocorallia sp. API 0066]|uniref:glutamate decarboxylase n=1 Tax=Actinocorallia sp. API 0066 TaxID=2896846 RepID=UPI001E456222|nr:glutamate decarboxylase [Actinocorallia sp. API 0066]MCD0453123.1 glutamate decarboxylase [Actinocorallia sp. API 0066]
MGLHRVRVKTDPLDDVFSTPLAEQVLPKRRMPDAESDARAAYEAITTELLLDGNSAQNLATFCTTWNSEEARKLMARCLDKNLIDKDEYPQTADIESRCVQMLAELWNCSADDTIGCSTTGSSEAAMLGGLALKWRWRKRMQQEGKAADRPNLVAGPVQVCWEKFCRYFDVELRQVPLEPGATGLRPHQLKDYVDENTIGVVAILGVTYTCDYEPVAEIAAELDRIQAQTGLDVPIHVDAASGGFVAPFLQPNLVWDFRVNRVASINSSGHKYGMAPLGCGWAVWASAEMLPEELIFKVNYLGGDMPTFALNFSRPGGAIVAQYYELVRLGKEGYRKIARANEETARYLAERIAAMGPFRLLYDGQGALPAVSYTLKDGVGWTLYDLTEQLRTRGWQVPSYPLPPDREDTVIQRVLVRHGVGRDEIALLADDIARSVKRMPPDGTHAPHQPGFHH